MIPDVQDRLLEPAPAAATPTPTRKSGRQRRRERRRRRVWFEELMGWILVPVILACTYWLFDAGLTAIGTSPGAVFTGISAVLGH